MPDKNQAGEPVKISVKDFLLDQQRKSKFTDWHLEIVADNNVQIADWISSFAAPYIKRCEELEAESIRLCNWVESDAKSIELLKQQLQSANERAGKLAAAIQGAVNIKDLWLYPDGEIRPQHQNEAESLRNMYNWFTSCLFVYSTSQSNERGGGK